VTALVALIVIFLCCVPLWRYALIMALVLGTVATSFTVKSIFRATWEQALLTNMFALAATTVGMTLLILLLRFLDISCSILDLVERHVPSIL
jgi:ribose/xylose/arabinose/galactoside ABC-type transport system permease subunit